MPGGGQVETFGGATSDPLNLTGEESEAGWWAKTLNWIKNNFRGGMSWMPDFQSENNYPNPGNIGASPNIGGGSGGGFNVPGLPPGYVIPPEFLPSPGLPPTGPPGPPGPPQGQNPGLPPGPPPGMPPMAPPGPQGGIPRPGGGGGGPRPPQQPMPPPWQWQWQGPQQPWQGPSQTVYRGGGPTPPPPWRLF